MVCRRASTLTSTKGKNVHTDRMMSTHMIVAWVSQASGMPGIRSTPRMYGITPYRSFISQRQTKTAMIVGIM